MAIKLPVLDMVSDQQRAVLEKSAELSADAYDTSLGFEELRRSYNKERVFWNEGGPQMAQTIDASVSTPHGEVAIRCHLPVAGETLPAIVYIHGGGWVLGNLDTHDRIMRALADASGAAVVGVDYTLSPEAKFPVALEQCVAVVRHLSEHGADYSIDGTRLALAGDSAGAATCLAAALMLQHQVEAGQKEVKLSGLALYYGWYGLADSGSRRLLGGPWDGLTDEDLDYYMSIYLADPSDEASPYWNTLSQDLSKLPPTYLVTAELDPLRDDTATLAAMLTQHGIPCRHDIFPGVIHAFLHNSRMLDAARDALANGGAFLRRALNEEK